MQASISKVKNWGKYSNGALNTDEWREIFLEAAQAGDLRRLVRVENKIYVVKFIIGLNFFKPVRFLLFIVLCSLYHNLKQREIKIELVRKIVNKK